MLSIPVPTPYDPQFYTFVVDLLYDTQSIPLCPLTLPDLHALFGTIGTSLDLLLYQAAEEIREQVEKLQAGAADPKKLFCHAAPELLRRTCARSVSYLSWDRAEQRLVSQVSIPLTAGDVPAVAAPQEEVALSASVQAAITRQCVQRGLPYVQQESADGAAESGASRSELYRRCEHIAVPIQLPPKHGELLGILLCSQRQEATRAAGSFSTYDLHTLDTFARTIAPSIERSLRSQKFRCFAENTLDIESKRDLDDAISTVLIALEVLGYPNAMISLYDESSGLICGRDCSGSGWSRIVSLTRRPIDGDDILAIALRTNHCEFVPNCACDPRCDKEAVVAANLRAQYVVPIRIEDELIGTMQVDFGSQTSISDDDALILQAFAGHLAIAISRINGLKQISALTGQVCGSSRFIVAETLSGMVVHSIRHTLGKINRDLERELDRKEVREHRLLRETLAEWRTTLVSLQADIAKALDFVRSGGEGIQQEAIDLHAAIQRTLDFWIHLIKGQKCGIRTKPSAAQYRSIIAERAFREALSVLIVNSVQAHAKQLEIETYNLESCESPRGNVMSPAFALEFRDDGIGLPTVDYESLFSPVYSTKSGKQGTGLGLYIARLLARQAGGDLHVAEHHRWTKGATFRMLLPAEED